MLDEERRVAHHVVQHSSALEIAAPEPRHVRAAVLFAGAREVRPAGRRSATRPEQRVPRFDLRSEDLVLEVSRRDADLLRQADDFPRFADVAGQRLLAGNAEELTAAALD